MLIVQLLIFVGKLKVHADLTRVNKTKWLLTFSFVTTVLSFLFTLFNLFTESNGLHESWLEYMMTCLKAKQDWVPYGNCLMRREVTQNIDFSFIEFKMPYITDMTGIYLAFIYQFNEEGLKKLNAQLQYAFTRRSLEVQNQATQEFIPRLHFGFSLNYVSIHLFCSFLNKNFMRSDEFVWQYFDLNNIDWNRMIRISRFKGLDLKQAKATDSEKSLLQICIENEKSDGSLWQLEKLMKTLLE